MITDLLLDIEGTICPANFVSEVLFPYARKHLPTLIKQAQHDRECEKIIQNVWQEWLTDDDPKSQQLLQQAPNEAKNNPLNVLPYLEHLITIDRKSTSLKELQGKVWDHGYATGDLTAELFPEAWSCLHAWKQAGFQLTVYSSGSIHAQKLLYSHTTLGDCSELFSHWFDTHIGPKKDANSYRRITTELAAEPGKILFISDSKEECNAAASADLRTLFSLREGNPGLDPGNHTVITSLDQVMDLATTNMTKTRA